MFGVHGVGGIVGAILTGVFANPALGVSASITPASAPRSRRRSSPSSSASWYRVIVSVIALTIVKAIVGLRVTETAEREGLDVTTHGERAYN